jgi:hypothetical protein
MPDAARRTHQIFYPEKKQICTPEGTWKDNLNHRRALTLKMRYHVEMPCNCAAQKVVCHPDNPQLDTSFPILIRTSPTSNVPAEPFSCDPSSAFNAGMMLSGSRAIDGKDFGSSPAASPDSVEKERESRGSGDWDVESRTAGWSRRTHANDAWKRGCS